MRRCLSGAASAWGQCAPASPCRPLWERVMSSARLESGLAPQPGPSISPLGVRMPRSRAALILAAVFSLSAVALGAEKGWFGLGVSVDVAGLSLNPTLRTITVQRVFASSPAASAGIVPGDTLVEVEGIVVDGAKADLIKPRCRSP